MYLGSSSLCPSAFWINTPPTTTTVPNLPCSFVPLAFVHSVPLATSHPVACSFQAPSSPVPFLIPTWASSLEDFIIPSALFPLYLLWQLAHWVTGVCLFVFFVEHSCVDGRGCFMHLCVPSTWHRVWYLEGTQIMLKWIEILWFFVVGFPFS